MELVQHIRDLLYHHDCVIVPGFGGFVTNERSARLDSSSNSFHPPSREVGFNARLDHNDGLLISYISARLSLNYVDAKKLTVSFAKDVGKSLEAGKTVNFEGIGRFSADKYHNLQFDPDPSANFLPEAYGLSFYRYPALAEPRSARSTTPIRISARKMLRYAAIGIPLIAALTWGSMNVDLIREFSFNLSSLNPFSAIVDSGLTVNPVEQKVLPGSQVEEELDQMSSMRRALMYEETLADRTPEKEIIAVKENAGMEETVAPVSAAASASVSPVALSSHYIVAGSFRSMQNAVNLSERLEKDGFACEVFESEKGMYRVSIFSSDNSREALQMLRQLRANESTKDVWMLST